MDRCEELKSRFSLIDTNNNSTLEKSELLAVFSDHASSFLSFCDADNDGSLTSEEFVNGILGDAKDKSDEEFQTEWLDRMSECIKQAVSQPEEAIEKPVALFVL